jgi:hypothetical protein
MCVEGSTEGSTPRFAACGLPGFKWSFRIVIKYVGYLYERNLCWKEEISGTVEINILGQ